MVVTDLGRWEAMKLKPKLLPAGKVGAIHFAATVITSLAAAGQSDSMGRPHGYGWIASADILAFPLSAMWDRLQHHFSFSDAAVIPTLFVQSLCWGVIVSMFIPRQRKIHRETSTASLPAASL